MSGSESEMKQVPTLQSVDAAKDLPKELACRPCPVCCGNQKKVLYKQKFSGLSAGSFLHSYEVCVCAGCGMGFADRLPPADEFDRYYAEMSQWEFLDNQGVESPQDMQRFETVTGYLIEENLDRETSILDIGCATGGLLAAFKRKGYKRLLGLDPSSRCAELARKNYGIDVVTSTVGKLSELPGKFGLITLSGVLEHLYDPNPALAEIHRLLDEGGFFYVNVPDAEGFVKYQDGPYQQFSIEHIQYFTAASLINLMAVNGFQPVRLIATAQPYTLTYKYPGIEGLFKKAALSGWKQEKASESALTDYIRVSEKLAGEVEKQLDRLARSGDPVLVWGVGTNTQRLMASSPLAKANIIAFVDSNPHYHGKKVEGRPVLSPSEMGAYPHPVLIASFIFREEIKKQIREKLGLNNPLILLGAD